MTTCEFEISTGSFCVKAPRSDDTFCQGHSDKRFAWIDG